MRGVVRLPFAMLFSEDALGGSLSGATDRVAFTLSLPRLPADAHKAGFLLESPKTESWPCTETLGAMAWGYLGFECPASRRWQDFGSFKGGDGRGGEAKVYLPRPVPRQCLVWSDRVELDPELLGVAGQVKHVEDVLAVEPLVLQRLERSLPHAVLAWRLDPGANMPQLGMGGDERGESERPKRATVVGHQDHLGDLASLCVGDSFKQRRAEKTRGLSDGYLHASDRVVLVGRRGPMPTELILRKVARDPGGSPRAAAAGLILGEVELPHLVGAGRRFAECRLALRGEPPPLPLI